MNIINKKCVSTIIGGISGNVTYNGKTINIPRGSRFEMIDGKVLINGKPFEQYNEADCPIIKIEIIGNVESIETESVDVTIQGDASNIHTMSGDVRCNAVSGNVNTMSGDVTCDKNPRLLHALNIAYKYEKRYVQIPTKPRAIQGTTSIRHPQYGLWAIFENKNNI